jgi:hypothetical protein
MVLSSETWTDPLTSCWMVVMSPTLTMEAEAEEARAIKTQRWRNMAIVTTFLRKEFLLFYTVLTFATPPVRTSEADEKFTIGKTGMHQRPK